jgi:hypothetical protein
MGPPETDGCAEKSAVKDIGVKEMAPRVRFMLKYASSAARQWRRCHRGETP